MYFVTGTDTDVGKTVAAAWLMLHTGAAYWKPVQSGLADGPGDTETVRRLTGADAGRFHAPVYELVAPLSPHEAAAREGVTIDPARLTLPPQDPPPIVEGAGGLMVPLSGDFLMIDLIARLGLPVVLVCRSALGTINHTLLSLEALHRRDLPIAGLIISGPKTPHNRTALEEYGKVPVIAEIGPLDPLNKEALLAIRPELDLTGAARWAA